MVATTRHPLSESILSGRAPAPLCRAAARGAVPVPPEDLLLLQVRLASHDAEDISAAALDSLQARAADDIVPLVTDAGCPAEVLDWLALHRAEDGDLLAALAAHPETSAGALAAAAGKARGEALERLLDNQVRLLASPELLEALEANAALPGSARARLHDIHTELARRARRKTTRPNPIPGPGREAAPATAPPAEDEEAAAVGGAEPDAAAATGGGEAGDESPQPAEYDENSDTVVRIMNMSVPDKIQLAMKGNKEERAILVRDPIKVVALSVIKSPKLSEREVESIAGMRNVVEDVIRLISESREWSRNYAVVHALCKNPKTPVRKVQVLMSRLNTRDIKMLGGDRNVSEMVRTAARRIYMARTQPQTVSYKKK